MSLWPLNTRARARRMRGHTCLCARAPTEKNNNPGTTGAAAKTAYFSFGLLNAVDKELFMNDVRFLGEKGRMKSEAYDYGALLVNRLLVNNGKFF